MYLLGTDILIYSLKGVDKVVGNIRKYADAPKAISVISYGELVYGAYKSAHVASNLAKVHQLRQVFPIIDATAMALSYAVVTNNEKHFNKIPGLKVTNWAKS
ncbi:MAG: type II toxin-antitoxin system VapC family toxin [Gammaproteobacteria bacterium]|nr:type II toxin-antitoxin system VapC family toxin [Gammaproteobacteria bacterium]